MKRRVIAGIAILALSGCGSSVKHVVTQLDSTSTRPAELDTRGVVYSLPMTLLTVKVPVKLTITAPGQFKKDVAAYTVSPLPSNVADDKAALEAAFYDLGIKDPSPGTTGETKKLKFETATIVASAVQDPDHVYLVEIKGGSEHDTLLNMSFDANGFLTDSTSEIADRRLELFSKSVETVAGVATKAIGIGTAYTAPTALTTPTPNPYSKGLGVVQALHDIQRQRLELLGGGNVVNLSADAIKLMLESLAKEEQKLRSYFWTKKVVSWTAYVEFDPAPLSGTPRVPTLAASTRLFDVVQTSPDKLVTIENGSAALLSPIPGAFSRPTTCTGCTTASVNVALTRQSAMASTVGKQTWKASRKDLGFRYRIPLPVDVAIEHGASTLVRDLVPIAQLGEIITLPSDPGGTKSKYSMSLHAESGGLKKLEVSTTAITTDQIAGLGTAANALLDIEAKQKELDAAKAAKASEMAVLTAEVELLRLQKEKRELEQALIDEADE